MCHFSLSVWPSSLLNFDLGPSPSDSTEKDVSDQSCFILTRVARDWCIYASTPTLVGPQRFISSSICPSNPFERELSFANPSKRAAEWQNFWRLSNTDAPVCLHWWAVSPALHWGLSEKENKLSNRPDASSFFQSFRRNWRWQSPISQLICQIFQLIFDRSHVNASHDVPACKVIDPRTMDRLCVRGPNDTESVDKGNGEWKVRMQFSTGSVHLSQSSLGLNSQVAIDPRQSMRSGFHFGVQFPLRTRNSLWFL